MISSIGFVAAASDNATNHSIDVNDSSSSNLLELHDEIHYCPLGDNHYEIPEISADYIQEVVAKYFNISQKDIKSSKRSNDIAYPRQIAMYLSRELTDLSLPKIGEEFGGRDHTTVIHAHDKIVKDIQVNEEIKSKIEKIILDLKG